MALFSFFHKATSRNTLIIELGSGSVSAAIATLEKNSIPKIVYSIREQITFQKDIQLERILPMMLNTLDRICLKIQKEGLLELGRNGEKGNNSIHEIHLILSSPWSLSQTKISSIKLSKPTSITHSYISKVIDEQEKIAEVAAKDFFSGFHDKNDALVFEKRTIQIKLNGYKVNDVHGKIADQLDLALIVSIMPEALFIKISDTIGKYFNAANISAHSFTMSAFSAFRDIYPSRKSYIILDLSSEITDLSVIRDEVMSGGISFPIGRNHFVRVVAEELKISTDEAFSLVSTYHSGNLDKIYEFKIETSLSKAMTTWSDEFKKSLDTLSKEAYIPRTIFKITNDDFGVFFSNHLNNETFSQLGFSQEPFNVNMIEKNEIKKYCEICPNVKTDVFMMVNAIYLNKLYNI